MLMPVIICGNSCTNSAPHCTTNNSALATTDFRTNGNPDAAAKAGDKGGAVGGEILLDGVTIYQLTEHGLALQATLKGAKYWKDSEAALLRIRHAQAASFRNRRLRKTRLVVNRS